MCWIFGRHLNLLQKDHPFKSNFSAHYTVHFNSELGVMVLCGWAFEQDALLMLFEHVLVLFLVYCVHVGLAGFGVNMVICPMLV